MEGLDNETQDPAKLPTASLRSNSLLFGSKWQGIGEFRMQKKHFRVFLLSQRKYRNVLEWSSVLQRTVEVL